MDRDLLGHLPVIVSSRATVALRLRRPRWA
jgi:hypothetical protein